MYYRSFILIFLVFIAAISFIVGFKVEQSQSGELYKVMKSLDAKLGKLKSNLLSQRSNNNTQTELTGEILSNEIETGLLNLQIEWKKFSNARQPYHGRHDHTGGGITVGEDFFILLDPIGDLYIGTEQQWPVKTQITTPNINLEAYLAVKKSDLAYENIEFQLTPFKYNDLSLHFGNESTTLLISYTDFDAIEMCFQNIIAGYELENTLSYDSLEAISVSSDDWRVIYRSEPCLPLDTSGYRSVVGQMAGGSIVNYDDDNILLVNGDFFRGDLGLDPSNDYGKSLLINIQTGEYSKFTEGHRNTSGLVVTNESIFSVEHGPRGGDELNILEPGKHYGWPVESYGTTYYRTPMPFSRSFGKHNVYTPPLFSWLPSIGPSGIISLDNFHENWRGDLLISSLVAQSLFRVRLKNNRVTYVEQIPFGKRIRDLAELNGKLIVYSDDMSISYISPTELTGMDEVIHSFAKEASLSESNVKKLESGINQCMECHSMFGNDHVKAPGLQYIFESKAGSGVYPHYSEAMLRADIVWSEENIARYLINPQELIQGTSMQAASVDDETLQLIIDFLKYTDSIR